MRGIATGLAMLLLIPALADAQASRADTLRLYGMQMYVSVVSGNRPMFSALDTATTGGFADQGYQQAGEFFYRQWIDPITDDSLYRIISFAESPSSVGLEGTNVDGGGLLKVFCTIDGQRRVEVVTDGFLDGGSDGDFEGAFRFDEFEPHESGNWSVSADLSGAFVPEQQFSLFWNQLRNGDTLAVRVNDDAQNQYTYIFALDGFGEAERRVPFCE